MLHRKNISRQKPIGSKPIGTNYRDKTYRKLYLSGQKLSGDKTYRQDKSHQGTKLIGGHKISADTICGDKTYRVGEKNFKVTQDKGLTKIKRKQKACSSIRRGIKDY